MMKRLLAICLLMLLFIGLKAQQYGNEWINYSQNYYKIKITQNGIYRIDSTILSNTLSASGISLSSINPQNFQIFNKGVQQYIYIEGEGDGVFNGSDFIEFYAEKNDGGLDSLLYQNTSFIPNPYYSLVNDTAVYFLTWSGTPGNRMIPSTDTAFSAFFFPPDNYFFKEEIQSYNAEYYDGETDGADGTDSRYTRSEGWFGSVFNLGGSINYNISTLNIYASGPSAKIKTVVLGASKDATLLIASPFVDHHLQILYNGINLLKDTTFRGYESNRFIDTIPLSNLISGINVFQYKSIADPAFTSNRTMVSYINIKYPHTFDLEAKNNFRLYVPDNILTSKSLLDISNFTATGTVRLYDLKNARRIDVIQFGSNYKAFVPNGGEKKCYITSDGFITNITSLLPVTPTAQFTNYLSLPYDSAFIIVTHKSLLSSAVLYGNYRSSIAGGSNNVLLADIDELYDQFAYGIVKSPLSIRGLASYLIGNNLSAPPKNLFLMGKSIHLSYCRQNPTNYSNNLIPSWGNPSSDNLITAGLDGTIFAPGIPTGRLAARITTDIDWYKQKIVDYESNPRAEWMKQVLHFGGGDSPGLQLQLQAYLNYYKSIIQDVYYGATVKDIFKTSSLPIEINSSDTLRQLINSGVSLMTFFGHASGTSFDQSIDDWSTYSPPPGHYPFLLANSCFAGDIHSPGMGSTSESFTILQNNGVIGFLASVGSGIPWALNYFSSGFYKELSLNSYNKSVGTCIQNAIISIQPAAGLDELIRNTCFEMTLHGDPSIKINTDSLPDYKITNSDLFFDLATPIDSFTVYAVRTNISKAVNDTIIDELIRIKPNGDSTSYFVESKAPKYKDTVVFKIPVDATDNGVGLNKIIVILDRFNRVNELSESNNSTGMVNVFINGGDVVPVYPYEFAIIPKDSCTLRASTTNPFAVARNYILQIDTTDTFNSLLRMSKTINAPGGVISWKPQTDGFPPFTDTTVYYWRVAADSIDTTGYHWRESSFQYITNKRGWEQAHFFQFKNDGYQYTKFNRPGRRYDFVNDITAIQCIDGVPFYIPTFGVVYKHNGSILYESGWQLPGLTIAVFNPVSGEPWTNQPLGTGYGQYGSITGYPATHDPEFAFEFRENNTANRDIIRQFIMNTVPNGSYVLAYSQEYNTSYHSIPFYEPSLLDAFDSIGGSIMHGMVTGATFPLNAPYIIFGKKGGAPGSAIEIVGDSVSSIIQLDATIVSNWNSGFIASPIIGPATSWDSLSWNQHTLDIGPTADSIWIKVIGIKLDGTEDSLVAFNTSTLNINNLSTYANASIYPKMRLVAYMKDDVLNTPPQLDRWQVIYTPVPEAAINPPLGYTFTNTSVQEGDNINIKLPIQNISEYAFTTDSLLVTYWIEDANRVNHPIDSTLKKKPFNPGEVIIDTIIVSTTGYPGANVLWVEVNPIGKPRSQLEQYHFNNIARIPFTVSSDNINPLLDVTFDGIHILNNDIISAKPNVLIQLKDENQFLALNDTNDFKVFVKSPSSITAVRIYFGSIMTFIPAILPNNSCKINYTPTLMEDGTYQLIVQAKDMSDNQSGSIDYKINFEVVNKSTITEVMNYPNPFSTSTRFVFTLTGSEIPSIFKIQIMTITGKVVREVFLNELGSLHIGRNITDFAWDGKDEFGDQLANGVYLYHVITRISGEDIERRETAADQYFKKGWGKMFLMR